MRAVVVVMVVVVQQGYQSNVLKQLKKYLDFRRSHGLAVWGSELRDRYMSLLRAEVVKCKVVMVEARQKLRLASSRHEVDECSRLIKQHEDYRKLLVKRVAILESRAEVERRKYWKFIMTQIGASVLRTQRLSRLSAAQVAVRCELTWQGHDYAQWLAVRGSDEQLSEHIRSPQEWRDGVRGTVWVFFDHTPVWLAGTVDQRAVHASFEAASRQSRKLASRKRRAEEKCRAEAVLAEQLAGEE